MPKIIHEGIKTDQDQEPKVYKTFLSKGFRVSFQEFSISAIQKYNSSISNTVNLRYTFT